MILVLSISHRAAQAACCTSRLTKQPVGQPKQCRLRRGCAGSDSRVGGDPPPAGAGQPGALCPRPRGEPQYPVEAPQRCWRRCGRAGSDPRGGEHLSPTGAGQPGALYLCPREKSPSPGGSREGLKTLPGSNVSILVAKSNELHKPVLVQRIIHTIHQGVTRPLSIPIPLHRRTPVPTAKVDPGLRRESEAGGIELNQLSDSVH